MKLSFLVTVRFQPLPSAPILRKTVFKISASQKFETVVNFLRKKLDCKDTDSVFCYINNVFAPSLDEGVGGLYRVRWFCLAHWRQDHSHNATTMQLTCVFAVFQKRNWWSAMGSVFHDSILWLRVSTLQSASVLSDRVYRAFEWGYIYIVHRDCPSSRWIYKEVATSCD